MTVGLYSTTLAYYKYLCVIFKINMYKIYCIIPLS